MTHTFSQPVSSGSTATAPISLPAGKYNLFAYGYDGALSPITGPNKITVASAPGAPTGVQAEPGPESALLTWSPPVSNGGSAITGYSITAYDGTEPGAAAVTKACGSGCSPSGGFAFGGLTPGHSYTFKVKASNTVGTGALSSASPAVTVRATSSYADQVVAVAGDGSVQLSWEAQFLATSYIVKIYQGDPPGGGSADPAHFVAEETVDAADTTHVIDGLHNGGNYHFTVTPVVLLLLVGQPSEDSNPVVPFGVPFAPENVQALPGDGSVIVMWNPPGEQPDGTPGHNGSTITGYRITVYQQGVTDPVSTVEVAPAPTFAAVEGLQNGAHYSFAVQAVNAAGAGAEATTAGTLSPGGRPFAPKNVSATLAASRSVSVSWDPPGTQGDGTPGDNGHEITGYRVVVSPSCPSCEGTQVGQVTSTTITGLSAGVTYLFPVVATNSFGEGAASTPAQTVAISAEVPDAPTNVVAHWENAQEAVLVTWQPPQSNGSPIVRYTVVSHPSGTEATTTSTWVAISELDTGSQHTFRVRATNAVGDGPLSAPSAPATIPSPPIAPTNVNGEPSGPLSSRLTWELPTPDDAFTYEVRAFRLSGDDFVLTDQFNAGPQSSSFLAINLDPGVRYRFEVAAVNEFGVVSSDPSPITGVWDEDQARAWEFSISLEEFIDVRRANPPPYSFDSEGCSDPFRFAHPWDERFKDACKRHDFGSQNFGKRLDISKDEPTRNEVNQQFVDDMIFLCEKHKDQWNYATCLQFGNLYFQFVNALSGGFYGEHPFIWSECYDNPEDPEVCELR